MYDLTRDQFRQSRHQSMYIILAPLSQCVSQNLVSLSCKLPDTFPHLSSWQLVAIFRYPHKMVLNPVGGMAPVTIVHPPIPNPPNVPFRLRMKRKSIHMEGGDFNLSYRNKAANNILMYLCFNVGTQAIKQPYLP